MGELQLKQCQRCAEEIANYIKAGRAAYSAMFLMPRNQTVMAIYQL